MAGYKLRVSKRELLISAWLRPKSEEEHVRRVLKLSARYQTNPFHAAGFNAYGAFLSGLMNPDVVCKGEDQRQGVPVVRLTRKEWDRFLKECRTDSEVAAKDTLWIEMLDNPEMKLIYLSRLARIGQWTDHFAKNHEQFQERMDCQNPVYMAWVWSQTGVTSFASSMFFTPDTRFCGIDTCNELMLKGLILALEWGIVEYSSSAIEALLLRHAQLGSFRSDEKTGYLHQICRLTGVLVGVYKGGISNQALQILAFAGDPLAPFTLGSRGVELLFPLLQNPELWLEGQV